MMATLKEKMAELEAGVLALEMRLAGDAGGDITNAKRGLLAAREQVADAIARLDDDDDDDWP